MLLVCWFFHSFAQTSCVPVYVNGNIIWSRQIGSAHTGTDRVKAVMKYSDSDIIGTLNEDDSSGLSNPVVLKIAEDGTLRWSMKFDNGNDDSFTSVAFAGNTIYASGYYSTGNNRTRKFILECCTPIL